MTTKLIRKNLLLTVLLLLGGGLFAQTGNGVTVKNLIVSTGSPSTVTFEVSWKKADMPTRLSDTVWVFVDYNDAGIMRRLTLTDATLVSPSAPTATITMPNNQGAWVTGNARSAGSFSATVKLFTALATVNGICVYASNYPPTGQYTAAKTIKFTGTPAYHLVFGSLQPVDLSADSYTIPAGDRLVSFNDKTGAPGQIIPFAYTLNVSVAAFCEGGTGVTFALSGTQQDLSYQLYKDNVAVGLELSGKSDGSAATFSGTFNTAGVYTARSVAAGAYIETKMAGAHTVTENPLPAATVAAATVCYNTPATLTATLGAGTTTQMTYTWNYRGTSGTSTSSSFTTSALTATTTCTVQLTNANGCVGNISVPATITILPTVSSISTTGQTLCAGDALNDITVETDASGGANSITYLWTYSGTSAATLSTNSNATLRPPATLANSPGTYTFKRWEKDATCNTDWVQSIGEWIIKVNAPPVINTHPHSQALCGATQRTLSVTATAGSGATLSYQWKTNTDANVGTNSSSLPVSATGTYWVVVTDNNMCAATSTAATVIAATGGHIGVALASTCNAGRIGQ
jgi:hypothetical protein